MTATSLQCRRHPFTVLPAGFQYSRVKTETAPPQPADTFEVDRTIGGSREAQGSSRSRWYGIIKAGTGSVRGGDDAIMSIRVIPDGMRYPLADLALARRLERAEAHANARFVEARARLFPSSGARW